MNLSQMKGEKRMTSREAAICEVERRKFRRFRIPLEIKFKPTNEQSDYVSGEIKNFSRTGFCMESENTALNINENVEFMISMPLKQTLIPILGEIRWARKIDKKLTAGICIKKMDKGDKCDILDSCYDLWLESVRSENISSDTI